MESTYFYWLVGVIGSHYIAENYQKLLWKLFVTDYVWEVDYDKNRASDGLYLRGIFAQETMNIGAGQGFMMPDLSGNQRPCSVLEMLVALARKAEDNIMHDPEIGDRTGNWFWQMLTNLGLCDYDDYRWDEAQVDQILDNFLHHRYESNGQGGAFPVRKKTRDLRKTDLWWQMNAYLEEHYPL